jgi:CRISPR-associated protein Cmr4
MFEERSLLFLYAVSPVHMGAGQAIGVVDNPIQRERHTHHPVFAGAGLKGAFRDVFEKAKGAGLTERIFGPKTEAADHAGAVSFGDAQLVLFPIRSLREAFVYATSPTALARLHRLVSLAGETTSWRVPQLAGDQVDLCIVSGEGVRELAAPGTNPQKVVLETFEFAAHIAEQERKNVEELAKWLAQAALPQSQAFEHFREKVRKHLVVLSDTRFSYFVENATLVEPHVRIDDVSGTADDGGLFYTENVPPEALFVAPVFASKERVKKGSDSQTMDAKRVIGELADVFGKEQLVQIGGDATTGRGLVVVRLHQKGGNHGS